MEKFRIDNIGGEVIKDNDSYVLRDNKKLKNLIVSSTYLKPGQSTRGHQHAGQEEVYYFVDGKGKMELDDVTIDVGPGDVVAVEDGVFHRVHNGSSEAPMYFVCVFDGGRTH